MPAGPPVTLPAAKTWMSRTDTPPSASAPRAASDARSTRSLPGCLPNFVMWAPRIHTVSGITRLLFWRLGRLGRLEAEADRFDALVIRSHAECAQPDRHAEPQPLRIGFHVDEVRADAGAVHVDHAGGIGHGHTRGRHGHDRERAQDPLVGQLDVVEAVL